MMRTATDQDFDAVYEVYTDPSVYPYVAYDVDGKEDFRGVFEKMMARTYFWVFEDEAGIYGMATALEDIGRAAGSVYFGAFGIHSSRQGQGLGKKALQDTEAFLKQAGYKTMFFFVEGDNERGIAFYDRLGYKKTGAIPQYLKRANDNFYVDEVIYAKVLN